MTRRRQWSQHHPRPPQGQRRHARKRLPTTPPPHTTDTATTSMRHEGTGRQTEATTMHTPQPYRRFAASRITFSSPMASPPWNPMRGKSSLLSRFHYSTQRQTTHRWELQEATDRHSRYISSRRRSSNAEKTLRCILAFLHKPMVHNSDGAQQASAETVSTHCQEARIELEARIRSTSLSLRAPKPPPARHCA